jgi:hypothetical protein
MEREKQSRRMILPKRKIRRTPRIRGRGKTRGKHEDQPLRQLAVIFGMTIQIPCRDLLLALSTTHPLALKAKNSMPKMSGRVTQRLERQPLRAESTYGCPPPSAEPWQTAATTLGVVVAGGGEIDRIDRRHDRAKS